MRAFIASVVAALGLAVAAALLLDTRVQTTSHAAFRTAGVSIVDPGHNLVGTTW